MTMPLPGTGSSMMRFIKTTIVGGIVFLVPLIVILMVLGKAFGLMRKVSEPLSRFIPVESIAGVAVVDVLAVVVLLVLCFVAGMVAKSPPARRLYGRLDNALMVVPGYAFIRSFSDHFRQESPGNAPLKPVMVTFDDYSQLCFEIERRESRVVIYMPGAPDPWAGTLVYVCQERVSDIDLSSLAAVRHIRQLGRDSLWLDEQFREC